MVSKVVRVVGRFRFRFRRAGWPVGMQDDPSLVQGSRPVASLTAWPPTRYWSWPARHVLLNSCRRAWASV